METYRLARNVIVELPHINDQSSLRKKLSRKPIRRKTLERARELCVPLRLPNIKVEVVAKNIKRHRLCADEDSDTLGVYFHHSIIPADYPIKENTSLIVIREDDAEFLVTLLHEFGHALEPGIFKKDLNGKGRGELWAWFFAFLVFHEAGCRKEAEYCWREMMEWKQDLEQT